MNYIYNKQYIKPLIKIFCIIILLLLMSIIGCKDRSLFTELENNRLEVRIMGTFESNSPRSWQMAANYSANTTLSAFQDDSVDDYTTVNDGLPTKLMLDIAEMRLNGQKFANYRQTLTFDLNDTDPLFNGIGYVVENDDPRDGDNYTTLQIYFRKMLFDGATKYTASSSGGWSSEPYVDIFEEVDSTGAFNFNQFQLNTYYDSLRLEEDEINRIFPLEVPIIGGMNYSKDNEKTILEVRIVVKDFIQKFEYDGYKDGEYFVLHYYGFADWLREVKAGEYKLGGNVLAVARAYVPGNVGSITGNNNTAGDAYIIAIPTGDATSDYSITAIARGNTNCDLPTAPLTASAYIEPYLDYYLKYEKFKYDWQSNIGSCSDSTTYETAWAAYENDRLDFKLPPFVVYNAGSSSYTIENVPPGSYDVYRVNAPAYGEWFVSNPFIDGTPLTVTVTSGSSVTVNFP